MARARGFIKLSGSMGETTFKRGAGNKNFANDKIVVSEARRKLHPDFTSHRRQASNFGNASACAKVLRLAFSTLQHFARDSKMFTRLNAEMRNVVKKDQSPNLDLRQYVQAENLGYLLGFNFNEKVRLRVAFNVKYQTAINRETGECTINISPFKPSLSVKAPKYATHFRIAASAVSIDFALKESKRASFLTDYFKIDSTLTEPITIVLKLEPAVAHPIFIALGLNFMEETKLYFTTKEEMRRVNPLCLVDYNYVPVDKTVVEEPVVQRIAGED